MQGNDANVETRRGRSDKVSEGCYQKYNHSQGGPFCHISIGETGRC